MARNVADVMWQMLVKVGVERSCGMVGEALNYTIDGLRRNGNIDLVLSQSLQT